ncbi:MAG: hypothetical protein ABFS86_11995 [Planctomycetota bacterium]
MNAVPDFEDLLTLLGKHGVRYLIVGGLAFIYHAKPRFTKDLDLWVAADDENVARANLALSEFGSPALLDLGADDQVLQIGVAPNRIDVLRALPGPDFGDAWERRISATYGGAPAEWVHIEDLLAIKESIDVPRHREDARVLREVIRRSRG